jgi:hypothetical protein
MTVASDQGITVGAPTGGSKGAGTINVATNIFLNGTAYTNPDYVFESWVTGRIEKFADQAAHWANGAKKKAAYESRLSLEELEGYVRSHFRLPGIDDEPMGMVERFDFLLEKVEELFTHFFDIKKELRERMAMAS